MKPGAVILALGLAAVAAVSAQTPPRESAQAPPSVPRPAAPQQTPVFRSGTTVVPVTVSVVDERGKPVTDLKQSEFTVFENRKPREIVNFFPQEFTPGPVPPATASVNRVRDETIAPETRRTFLIVLGWGRIERPAKMLEGAIEFVRNHLLPQDAVAVMAFHRATNFTTDHEAIAQLLERYRRAHEKIVFEIDEYLLFSRNPYSRLVSPGSPATVRLMNGERSAPRTGLVEAAGAGGAGGGAPIPDKFLKMADSVLVGPQAGDASAPAGSISLRNTTDLLLGMARAVPVVEKPWQQTESLAEIQEYHIENGQNLSDTVMRSSRMKLFAGIEYLRYLDGEKHILFMGSGGLARNYDDAQNVARRATDARVVVDMVGSGWYSLASRDVVQATGGFYTSLDMAPKAVAKLDETTRFSYLLGYTPSNPTLDGLYREIEVKVSRPNVTVRFRHGYFAAAEPEPLVLKDLIVKSRLATALAYDTEAKDIKVQGTAYALPRMGLEGEVRVQLTVDSARLAFETTPAGRRTGRLELQAYCGDAKEQIVGEFSDSVEIDADAETFAGILATGIRRTLRVPVQGAAKYVKVVVYDYGSDRVGSLMLTLK